MPFTHATPGLRGSLALVAQRKLFFGHQSVGAEVVRGLAMLAEALEVPINIVETSCIAAPGAPCFAHARIGRNGDAASKFDDFAALLDGGLAAHVELAMMKLCYVDVTRNADTAGLARRHDAMFEALSGRYPDLRLVAVTVPLTTGCFGLRGRAATLLGRNDPALPDNRARCGYNDHLRAHYAASGRLFDLAAVESAAAVGSPGDSGIPALAPALTRDGGHLNRRGRKLAAIALTETLGRLF